MSNAPEADVQSAQLAADLGLTPSLLEGRLAALALGPTDRAKLRATWPTVQAGTPAFLDRFYERLLACPSTRGWLTSPELVARLKRQQLTSVEALFTDEYDFPHALRCLRVGMTHHRIRLTPQWFVASYAHFLCEHVPQLLHSASSLEEGLELVITLTKSALLDAALSLDGYAMSAENDVRLHRVPRSATPAPANANHQPPPAHAAASPISRARVATDEATERAAFLGIDATTLEALRSLSPFALEAVPPTLDGFYRLFSTWGETAALVPAGTVDRLKRQVGSYWHELFRGAFDRPYAASRTLVGIVHERIGLSSPLYLVGLAQQLATLMRLAVPKTADPVSAVQALLRAVFFDASFVLQAYVQARAEAVLRSDGFASELLAGLSAGVALVDQRLRVESMNPALATLFPIDPGLARLVQLEQLVPMPAAAALVRQAWEQSAGRRHIAVIAHQARTFRATAQRLMGAGNRESVALVLDEITDLVKAQHLAQDDARGFGRVLDTVEALLWEAEDEVLTVVSRSALAVTGHRDVALLGRQGAFEQLIPEPDRAVFVKQARALVTGERKVLRHRLQRADGVVVWLDTELARCSAKVLCGVSVDVTRQVTEERRRIEALGRLGGGIAHEFNNRLTVILSSLSLLESPTLDQGQAELIREAKQAAERSTVLTQQLLSVAQRQVLRPKPVVLNEVLGSARGALTSLVGRDIELELKLEPSLWRCNLDAKELETALVNLVANARDSMPVGGRVTVSTRNVPSSGEAEFVEVTVEDTGEGMDERVRHRAFEPFFTTRPAAAGLGLSMVHGFVSQSGGQVSLTSSEGHGTVVRLRFPRLVEEATPVGVDESSPFVLVVDDEPSLRLVMARLVKRLGLQGVAVGTVKDALNVVRTRRVDLLVTDVVLADGESGAALGPEARLLKPGLPVLYVSGYTRQELDLEKLGPLEWFLPKPFVASEFEQAVRAALAASGQSDERRPASA